MDHGDVGRRQLGFRVQGLDRGVIPLLDVADEDRRQRLAVQHQLARGDAFEIHHRNHAADDRRELDQAGFVQLFDRQRLVGGAESHGLRLDLLDPAAGADRLVVQPGAGFLLVGIGPLGGDRVEEGRASTGDVLVACGDFGGGRGRLRAGGDREDAGDQAGQQGCAGESQGVSPGVRGVPPGVACGRRSGSCFERDASSGCRFFRSGTGKVFRVSMTES